MADFDLFNGDADGIFSLLQLRQTDPRPDAERVTGLKRDIELFARIADRVQPGDRVTALDISLAKNRDALQRVLDRGADVFYCDHHQTGDIPESPRLTVISDESEITCTSYLIDDYLRGAKTAWAICGAYGDNFPPLADRLARRAGLKLPMGALRELGELVNYNAYGLHLDELHFHPAKLFEILLAYPDPMAFLEDRHPAFETLQRGFATDWDVAQSAREIDQTESGDILVLPNRPASNRISGLFGNALVDEDPHKAFAILTEQGESGNRTYRVSIRAPRSHDGQNGPGGSAAELAAQFAGGGGRRAAGGINALPEADLPAFIEAFRRAFAP